MPRTGAGTARTGTAARDGSDAAVSVPSGPSPEGLRRVLLNGIHLLLAYGLPRVFTVGAVILAARVLGTADFGAYGAASAYAVIMSIVSTLGMMPLLIRDLARDPGRAATILRAAHAIKTGSNVVMLAALLAVAHLLLRYPPAVVAAALLLGVAYAVGSYVENLAAYFQARERMMIWTWASALYGLVTGLLGAGLVVATSSVVWFCVAPVVGQLAALAWLASRLPDEARGGGAPTRAELAALGRALAPYAVAFVALTVYCKIDVLLLSRWRPLEDVGIYTAAYKFVDLAQALAGIAVVAVYPCLSRLEQTRGPAGRWAGTRVAELVLLGALPSCGLLWLVRGPVIEGLYGVQYRDAVGVFGLLVFAIAPLALNTLANYLLSAAARMGRVAILYGVAVPVNVGLNASLIPAFGPAGAAVAKLVSEVALAVGFLAFLGTDAAAFPGRRTLVLAAGTLVLLAAAAAVPDPSGGPAAALAYGLTVTVLYWRGSAVSGDEIRALRRAVGGPMRADGLEVRTASVAGGRRP